MILTSPIWPLIYSSTDSTDTFFSLHFSLIEKGKSFPKSETLVKMVNIFGCNTKDLFDFEPIENVENLKEKLESLINELPEEKLKVLYIVGKNI